MLSTSRPRRSTPKLVGEVLKVMRHLAQEGRTMVVVTHEMGFAREVSNQLVFLHKGLVEEHGACPKEVLASPAVGPPQAVLSAASSSDSSQGPRLSLLP